MFPVLKNPKNNWRNDHEQNQSANNDDLAGLVSSMVMFGRGQSGTLSKMDKSMNTMEDSKRMMNKSEMKGSADTMNEKKMETPMKEETEKKMGDTVKNDSTGKSMGERENTMLQPEKKEMMK